MRKSGIFIRSSIRHRPGRRAGSPEIRRRCDKPAHVRLALLVGLAGASAVLLGAFGAHALRGVLDARAVELWHTAVEYHAWHALALALAVALGRGRSGRVATVAFAAGIMLFSGSLYALALGAPRWVGIVTPFGGLAFVAGWLALGWALRPRHE